MTFVMAALLSAAATAAIVSGQSAPGPVDTVPPEAGSLILPANTESSPIPVGFSGVSDADSSIAFVELWYRSASSDWSWSGQFAASGDGSFNFAVPGAPPANHGVYYFGLVAEDEFGNRSALPNGDGQGSVEYTTTAFVQDWWILR
jgi:hypothetical protein